MYKIIFRNTTENNLLSIDYGTKSLYFIIFVATFCLLITQRIEEKLQLMLCAGC